MAWVYSIVWLSMDSGMLRSDSYICSARRLSSFLHGGAQVVGVRDGSHADV